MKYNVILLVLGIICSMCFASCESKEEKQESAIHEYMNKTYVDYPSYECVETQYLDSIQDIPVDYICLIYGLNAYKALHGIAGPALDFIQCYKSENANQTNGRISINPQTLSENGRQKYLVWMDSVRTFAVKKKELIEKVRSYEPHSYIRVFKKYRVKGSGKDDFVIARFYFDSNLNLTNQLILSEEDNKCAVGMIIMAINNDFSNANRAFSTMIDLPDDEVLNSLADYYPYVPIEKLVGMSNSDNAEEKIDIVKSEDEQKVKTPKEERKRGYNPPEMRNNSGGRSRADQFENAFDIGRRFGYETGYKDGKNRRRYLYSFDSSNPYSDDWIEQMYIQGYEVGYIEGFDDAGGDR